MQGEENPKKYLLERAKAENMQPIEYAVHQAKQIDVQKLKKKNNDFAKFYNTVVSAAKKIHQ